MLLPIESEGCVSEKLAVGGEHNQQSQGMFSYVYQAPGSMASFLKRSVISVFSTNSNPLETVTELSAATASITATAELPGSVAPQPQQQQQQRPEDLREKGRGEEGAKEETSKEEGGKPAARPVVDISSFLQTSWTLETRYIRMLASLCALTYSMPTLTVRTRATRRSLSRRVRTSAPPYETS